MSSWQLAPTRIASPLIFCANTNSRRFAISVAGATNSLVHGTSRSRFATRDLPRWELRAEFWIEHAGTEYAPSGVAVHAATDQVRFCGPDQQNVALTDVPALVFSEVMRDVDLFVSVSSVGNDPAWAMAGRIAHATIGGSGLSAP